MKITFLFLTILFVFHTGLAQEMSKNTKKGADHFAKKEYELALKYFLKEDKKNPSINNSFWLGHTYAEMDNISKAKPIFSEIVHGGYKGPEYAMALLNLGHCFRKTNPDSAYHYYDKGKAEFPKMVDSYYSMGTLLYAQSKFEKAKLNFTQAIEVDPTVWIYYQKRLEVCFATEDYECALQDLIKVRELNPKAQNEMNLAFCYTMLERYEEADSMFQMIYNENDAFFLNNFGMNKHNLGESEAGKKLIEKSLKIDPNNSYAYRNLAVIAIEEKDEKKVCEYLDKAKELGFTKKYGKEVQELSEKHCK